jgi:hypothetical protein
MLFVSAEGALPRDVAEEYYFMAVADVRDADADVDAGTATCTTAGTAIAKI